MLMVVMTPRETWTDERLDEFKASVNQRFDEVDKRFDQVDKRFEQVDKRFEQVDDRFNRVEAQMKEGFARVDADIRELRQTVERMNMRMTTGFIGLAGLIVSSQIFF
jgi:DNA anti-recombination protein RmuC